MGFLDDLWTGIGSIGLLPTPRIGAPSDPVSGGPVLPPFFGDRPGFDLGDIPDIFGRLLRGNPNFPWPTVPDPRLPAVPSGGGGGSVLPEIGAEPPMNGGGAGGQQLRTTGARTAMHIGGNCPGLWHDTPIRQVFSPTTGEFLRTVGGNRVANRVSLVQDDSGALEFVSPVKATWSLKYKTRRHHHHRRAPAKHHYHRRARRKTGHRHSLTRKQLAAGFGGKSHMKAHR